MKKKEIFDIQKLTSSERLYNLSIPIIGITGGVATGKSTISNYLKNINKNVICADSLVKKIYQKDSSVLFIKENFSNAVDKNKINFKTLRTIFFNNPIAQKKIEDFIYPQIKKVLIQELTLLPLQPYIIYDIPLLFEKNYQDKIDYTVCVYANADTQLKRLIKRDNITRELASNIINKQLNIEEKKQKADFVIDNNYNLTKTYLQTQEIIDLFSTD